MTPRPLRAKRRTSVLAPALVAAASARVEAAGMAAVPAPEAEPAVVQAVEPAPEPTVAQAGVVRQLA